MSAPATLDEIDRLLIAALVEDGRATYAALAPVVGMSQASVRTRVQRLLEDRVISVTGRVDPASLGIGEFAFAFLEIAEASDKMAGRLADIDEVVFVVVASGRFDLMIELRCATSERLVDALDRVRETTGVRRMQVATVLHYDKQDWTGVGRRDASPADPPNAVDVDWLDDVDRQLLIELTADGRASYAALATEVGLSPAAVRERVLDLLDRRAVTIQAHPVPEAMGIAGFAGLGIQASSGLMTLSAAISERAETCVVVRTLGRFDLLAEVWFESPDHLAELLDWIRCLGGVTSLDTVPYHRVAHERFGTGLRRR